MTGTVVPEVWEPDVVPEDGWLTAAVTAVATVDVVDPAEFVAVISKS
jgi:hypothetical protein